MTLALHQEHRTRGVSSAPFNLEAEQALLGAIMYDNAAYERIGENIAARHFYEPFHQRLFGAIDANIRKGHLAEPILLADQLKADPAFEEMGGLRYLADLIDRAPPAAAAADYSRAVYEVALRREAMQILADGVSVLSTELDISAREQIEQVETDLYGLAENKASSGLQTFSHFLSNAMESAAAAYQRDGGLTGLSTGLIDLDQKLGGLHRSDLIIVAGRPSMGKTALATNIAFHIAKSYVWERRPDGEIKTVAGGKVAFFSLEMSGEQLSTRILAEQAGVSGDRIRKGAIEMNEYQRIRDAAIEIEQAPLHIDETGAINIGKLAARARRMKRQGGLDCVVVDYLQLIVGSKRYSGGQRVEEVSEVTAGLKALAKELDVPVVALSQLSRQVENREDKRPMLSDLRESGSIEQDADVVMFCYREAYYLERAEPKEATPEHLAWQEEMEQLRNVAECIVAKQRHGPIGTVKLSFNGDITKFGNLAHDQRFTPRGAVRDPSGGDR